MMILQVTKGNLSIFEAVSANLLGGASCMIGGLIAASVDLSPATNAYMLAFGAGTYLWIGTVECFPCLMVRFLLIFC